MDSVKIQASQKSLYEKAKYWTDESLLDRWNRAVSLHWRREFVVDDRGGRYTYARMDTLASRFASWLYQSGIKPGDVVSFQFPPCGEFVIAAFGCLKAGAVIAPLGTCFQGDELAGLLNLLGSKLHLYPAQYKGRNWVDMMADVRDRVPGLRAAALPENEDGYDLSEILSGMEPLTVTPHTHGNDVTLILCTSGTTRGCKAVMFTHNNIIFSEEGFNRAVGLTAEDTIFMPAPLSHATGFHHGIISPMLRGGKIALQRRFSCREAIDIMNRERCTYSMGTTPFAYDLLNEMEEGGHRPEHLRFYLCGGAPVPTQMVRRAWNDFKILICEVYGSTESVPHALVRPDEALEMNGHWSGRAMEGVEIRVVDENRRDVPPGQIGEEASRGPNVFVGYLKDRETTDSVLDDEGWFYSGDLCVSDEAGNIRIMGRKKDIIIRGGENLNSNEINENLEGCPGIADHSVVGMPDERLGERICAYVVPKAGYDGLTLRDVLEYLAEKRIPKRYWPERLELIDAIPRTESGKVKKHVLVEDVKRRMALDKETEL